MWSRFSLLWNPHLSVGYQLPPSWWSLPLSLGSTDPSVCWVHKHSSFPCGTAWILAGGASTLSAQWDLFSCGVSAEWESLPWLVLSLACVFPLASPYPHPVLSIIQTKNIFSKTALKYNFFSIAVQLQFFLYQLSDWGMGDDLRMLFRISFCWRSEETETQREEGIEWGDSRWWQKWIYTFCVLGRFDIQGAVHDCWLYSY